MKHLIVLMLALTLSAVTLAADLPKGTVAEREGGLLLCETLPGEAMAMRRGNPLVVPRADGGVTGLLFLRHQKERTTEVVYLDLTNGGVRREKLEPGLGNPWPRRWGPDGKLYFGMWGPATLLRYDPTTDRIEQFGVIEPDDKTTPILTVGTDDNIYAITGPEGKVISLDPETDAVRRWGRIGPERRYKIAYRGSLGVSDDYIYLTFGNVDTERWTLAYNKATGETTPLEAIRGARILQRRDGVEAVVGRGNDAKQYWLRQGEAIEKKAADEPPPWPEKERPARVEPPKLPGRVEFLPNSILSDDDGNVLLWYRIGKGEWRSIAYAPVEEPVMLRCVGTLPDGRVFGVGTYVGVFTYDLAAREITHQGVAPMSNYALRVIGPRVYFASYPGGNSLFVWDSARPWTLNTSTPGHPAPAIGSAMSNPRRLPSLVRRSTIKNRADLQGFQHPWFMVRGIDHTLYAAFHGERHNVGGAIAWHELDTGAGGVLREGFELYEPSGLCTVDGGRKIVFATTAVAGVAGEPKPESGRLFVIDVAARTVEGHLDPLPGVDSAGLVAEGRPGHVLCAVPRRTGWDRRRWNGTFGGSVLYEVNVAERTVTRAVEFDGLLAGRRSYYMLIPFERGPDGGVYTFYDDTLCRIDPATLEVTLLSKVLQPVDPNRAIPDGENPWAVGKLTFHGRDVIIGGASHFRRVRNAVEQAR